jgi:ceramide glucosyltransferase
MRALAAVGLAGLGVSTALYAVAAAEVRWLRKTGRGQRVPGFSPPVSILKPLRGLDEGLEENLASFFRLQYPRYEVVFSFADRSDPAYPVAREVADRYPKVPATFVFDPRDSGGNAKIDRLAAAAEHARHRLLMFSDGNVRVRPDFLGWAVSYFADSRVGLVSHLFRASGASSLASRIESLLLNGCLLPGTASIAGILKMPCVVGKSILVSRTALEVAGGFPALRNYLAEDYLIGREVRRAGYRVVLSADVIDTIEVNKSARAVWDRHRRWALMRRRLGGALYLCEAFSGALPWAVAASAAGGWLPAALLLAARYALEGRVADAVGSPHSFLDRMLLPLRDLGATAVFVAGLTGRSVRWRGRDLSIGRDTRIVGTAA